ncbi:helix-turn-helix domain-containing protein [Paenibacillus sp. N3.4]|uniref:helix-turn-helix domain-containing protein n=1 Tax=Paenibacillus sp. N3.4 TaxID=2603222 RepID=UPI0011CB88C5|nr:helix-turn-helix domain-containing protein [Paenibacillus sp. N3.4]TXK86002.1 helix-turn-helix domain-containing protein [Paenibacillus sp. N3.4]
MLQLLVVDDEIHAVRGIKAGVQWELLGFSKVHEAFNIRQAKEIFLSQKIDVLICDIEMPEGDGFQLLEWVKEHAMETEALFLTCHADFGYAQKAIQLGSMDYMLKPVRFAELEKAVRKAIEQLEKKRDLVQFNDTYKHYYQLWESYQPMVVERFWQDLIHRSIPSNRAQIKEIMAKQNIPYFETVSFLPIWISVQRWHKKLTLREEKIMEYALRNSLEELAVRKEAGGQIVQVKSGGLLVILSVEPDSRMDKGMLSSELQGYIHACNQYFFCDLCCYIGDSVPTEGMLEMFELLVTMESNNVTQTNKVFFLSEQRWSFDTLPLPKMNSWAEMLKNGCKAKLLKEIDYSLNAMRQLERLDAKLLREFYEDFLQMSHHVLHYKGLRAHQVFSEQLLSLQASSITRSIADLRHWLTTMVEEATSHIHANEECQTVVEKAKQYIHQHINEDVSREDIASHVNMNPDYLTRIFKRETGLTISDYVLQERVELAKDLLMRTDLPIGSIASSVGYNNFSHFSKMFKKATAINPQDYRKLNDA